MINSMYGVIDINDMVGEIMKDITLKDNEIIFKTMDNQKITMCHLQDCCEDVYIEDIVGDIDDLLWEEIIIADCVTNENTTDDGSETWTFYKLGTRRGSVTIRWYGTSNGCYSESADLVVWNI